MTELLQTSLPMPRAPVHSVTDFTGGGHLNPSVHVCLELLKETKKEINP